MGPGSLKPQDVVVLLKIHLTGQRGWTFLELARQVGMASSEVHGAVGRAEHAQLYSRARRQVRTVNLEEFLVHGVRYAFAAQPGAKTRGVPSLWDAPPLAADAAAAGIAGAGGGQVLVWPEPGGPAEGMMIAPLYRSVPSIAVHDPALYALLALVDVLRLGSRPERQVAASALAERLKAPARPAADDAQEVALVHGLAERVAVLLARPGTDLYESRELGEIVGLLEREAELAAAVGVAPAAVRGQVAGWARALLAEPEHLSWLEEHLPRGPAPGARLELVVARLRLIAAQR